MRSTEQRAVPRLLAEGCTDDGRVAVSLLEVASLYGLGRSTVYAAAKRGDIRTIRVGGRVLVSVANILDGSIAAGL